MSAKPLDDKTPSGNTAAERAAQLIELAHELAPLINPSELNTLMNSQKSFSLIDIRSEAEYEAGHLIGATFLPRSFLEFAVRDSLLGDGSDKIVLYCRSGNRSALAVKQLMELGFTDICHLGGGFEAWFNEGLSFYNRHGEVQGIAFEAEN